MEKRKKLKLQEFARKKTSTKRWSLHTHDFIAVQRLYCTTRVEIMYLESPIPTSDHEPPTITTSMLPSSPPRPDPPPPPPPPPASLMAAMSRTSTNTSTRSSTYHCAGTTLPLCQSRTMPCHRLARCDTESGKMLCPASQHTHTQPVQSVPVQSVFGFNIVQRAEPCHQQSLFSSAPNLYPCPYPFTTPTA